MKQLQSLTPQQKAALAQMPEPMAVQLIQRLMTPNQSQPMRPQPVQMDAYDQGGPASDPNYRVPMDGYVDPLAPDDYLRDEMGAQDFQRYQQMNRQQQLDYLNNPQNGFVPPAPLDTRELLAPQYDAMMQGGAGQDAVVGQQASDSLGGIAQPLALGEDNVSRRRIEERELALRNGVNGLQAVLEKINGNPDLLENTHTFAGRARMGLLNLRDRSGIDAIDIGPEQEQAIGDTAQYRQLLLTNVNQYIKDITGAQVGQGQETTRLMAVQPNESDSPAQLVAKLQGAIDMGRINIARMAMMRRSPEAEQMTDAQIRQRLGQLGKQFYQEALQSGASPTDARLRAAQRLSREYGL